MTMHRGLAVRSTGPGSMVAETFAPCCTYNCNKLSWGDAGSSVCTSVYWSQSHVYQASVKWNRSG